MSTTINLQIVNGADDAQCTTTSFEPAAISVPFSYGTTSVYSFSTFRFQNVIVPQGKKITSAIFSVRSHSNTNSNGQKIYIFCHNVDNSPVPGGLSEIRDREKTRESVIWTLTNWTAGTWYSVDIKDCVQAVINRSGWVSGNSLTILTDTINTNQGTYVTYVSQYDANPSYGAKLDITYEDSTSTTVYITPNIDSSIYRRNLSGELWSSLVNGVGTASDSSSSSLVNTFSATYSTNNWNELSRSLMIFDTSTIPDDATIESVNLYIYIKFARVYIDNNLNVCPATTASNTSIVTSDYQLNKSSVIYSTLNNLFVNTRTTPNVYYSFPFSITSGISKTGLTKLSLKWSGDTTSTEPSWVSSSYSQISFYSKENINFQPILKVVYSTGITPQTTITTSPAVSDTGGIPHY